VFGRNDGGRPGDARLHRNQGADAESVADFNAVLARGATLSASLAKYNLTLNVPAAIPK
jgi:hypothetical protein